MQFYKFLIFTLCIFSAITSFAQSSNTDTLDEGRMYFEANFWTGTQNHDNGGSQIYGGRFSYGLTKKVEIGMGASIGDPRDPEYPPEIQPSIKYKFYDNETRGIIASGGAIAYVPVAQKRDTDAFVMVYTNVSKDFKGLNNPRITVGGYALVGRNKDFGSRKGWNIVYDQPLTRKVAFSAQWVTGKNRFGYFTPGASVVLTKNSSLFLGYSVGNYDYDNHGPYVSYSIVR